MDHIDALIARLRRAAPGERAEIKAELTTLATGAPGAPVRDHLESAKRGELLEVQWEIEDVLEATTPKRAPAAAPPPPPPEPKPDPNKPLTSKDLTLVYDDPRGLLLHKSKVGDRWFATQHDQRTGQPQTFELQAQEVDALKKQLAGSPYWVLGAKVAAEPPRPPSPLVGGPRR
jgi:hypothetical protein